MKWIFVLAALLMALYHMVASQKLLVSTYQHYAAHLGFALTVLFLAALDSKKNRFLQIILILALLSSIFCWGYIHFQYDALQTRAYFNTPLDLVVGFVLIVLVITAAWISFGPLLPCIAIAFVFYPFIGTHLPEPFYCQAQSVKDTIVFLSVSLDSGIFSPILSISANYIFLFILFGGILQSSGATRFFMQIGMLIGSKIRGGPGITSVVSSALVGSVTGSPVANIAITGSFTIPLMKKVGYEPHQAGAIEAAASTGGLIMPPIMGANAFLMAGLTGISYLQIVKMSILPGIFYFFCVFMYVYLRGEQLQLSYTEADFDLRSIVLSSPMFLGPLAVIMILLIMGYSVTFTAFWAVIAVVILPLLNKETRPSIGQIIEGFANGAKAGAGIAAMLGTIGLLYSTFTFSGLGIKLSAGIQEWTGGILIFALILIAAICIFLGMAGLGGATYIIVSIFAVPALMKMGVEFATAHFFIVYITAFGVITPPVAAAAIVASKLTGAPYMQTAVEGTKVAFAGILLPYFFIPAPILLLMPQETTSAILSIIACALFIITFQITFVGHYFTECSPGERILFICSGLIFIWFFIFMNSIIFAFGIVSFILLTTWQWRRRRLLRGSNSIRLGALP